MGSDDSGIVKAVWQIEGIPFVPGQAIRELTADDMTDEALGVINIEPGEITIEGIFTPGVFAWPQLLGIYKLNKKGRQLWGKLN